MPETIFKTQPNRVIALRGFDPLGASAAIHSATATSFKVTGHFPQADQSAFVVVLIHDADDFLGTPPANRGKPGTVSYFDGFLFR